MIIFSAFTPHSPLLLPSIGKSKIKNVAKTTEALKHLHEELYASHPDVLVIISSHSDQHENAFSINLHDSYHAQVKEFGDLETSKEFLPEYQLIDQLQRHVRSKDIPLTLDSHDHLDHGSSVPLLLLTEGLENLHILPISYSNLSEKDHIEFGRALKDVLVNSKKRIAIIATGDLSHCLSTDAPAGFKKEGEIFDKAIQEALKDMTTSKLLSLDPNLIEEASECAYRPLLILFGILERMNTRTEILSYEAPFGVGYLTAQFHL
jgi:MEMO1 family protein